MPIRSDESGRKGIQFIILDTHWNVEGRRTAAAFIASHLHGRETRADRALLASRKLPAASGRARDGEFKLDQNAAVGVEESMAALRTAYVRCGASRVGCGNLGHAPVCGADHCFGVCVILLQAMRHLFVWRWRRVPAGRFVVWAIGIVAVASFIATFVQQVRSERPRWGAGRANLIAQLNHDGMRHLVIVRYGPQYSTEHKWAYWEWVYNEADIDSAQVVWAREMNMDQNRKLLEYFKDRKVWLLELHQSDSAPMLVPYPLASRQMIWAMEG